MTRLLGQSRAHVGRAMVDSARCISRNGDPDRAAAHAEAVLTDFDVLLERFAVEDPFDEHVVALEYLLASVELIIELRGASNELDTVRTRTRQVLARSIDS